MEPGEPTHFNVLVAGTGLQESVLAAALSKAGYSVLQLDTAPYYGTEHASLSLAELHAWCAAQTASSGASTSSADLPADLARLSQRFSLSLQPVLLRAQGVGLDLLVRSRVASYLQFGLLGGVGLYEPAAQTGGTAPDASERARGRVKRVPASKSDVFTDASLSLVEKRRLTKLLLFAAGPGALEEDPLLQANPDLGFVEYLKKGYSLSGTIAGSLAYALALCTSSADPALPALRRIRSTIHAIGRYGPSPYLVGHYGGAGDLVGGFSRICAVWGGGQILGRPILPLEREPAVGPSVPPSQPPFSAPENPPPPPAQAEPRSTDAAANPAPTTLPLGIPVRLEEGADAPPTVFTGDWVVASPHLLPTLFPSVADAEPPALAPTGTARTAHLIAILSAPIPFPARASSAGFDAAAGSPGPGDANSAPAAEDKDGPDSHLFVFPPETCRVGVESVTALQTGPGTMSCPEGYRVLYLSGTVSERAAPSSSSGYEVPDARALLEPYLDALLALAMSQAAQGSETPAPKPVYTAAYYGPTANTAAPASPASLPLNLLVTPSLTSTGQTRALTETLDEVATSAEELFWRVVGEEGRRDGVQFFAKEERGEEDEEV
ncbi:hypothetical protein JCM8202_004217 [Rhodotorula sphaerocarpa]